MVQASLNVRLSAAIALSRLLKKATRRVDPDTPIITDKEALLLRENIVPAIEICLLSANKAIK
jgi:hypothetical protein